MKQFQFFFQGTALLDFEKRTWISTRTSLNQLQAAGPLVFLSPLIGCFYVRKVILRRSGVLSSSCVERPTCGTGGVRYAKRLTRTLVFSFGHRRFRVACHVHG